MKNRAFTLIELLVVIGILAALLLPALSRAKASAKRVHCVGNIKQLSLATHLYPDDHSDYLPDSAVSAGIGQWDTLLLDGYLNGDTNLFQCHANNSRRVQSMLANPFFQSSAAERAGFPSLQDGLLLFNFAYGLPLSNAKKRSWIVSPSDHIQLGDAPLSGIGSIGLWKGKREMRFFANLNLSLNVRLPKGMDGYVLSLTRRHSGVSNMAFSDGHVEHGSLREWSLPVEEVHRRWHYDNKAHLDRLRYRDADNWFPLYGADEDIPLDN